MNTFLPLFYKGPITSCEYYNDDTILIGCGPYLSLINEYSYEEIFKCLALRNKVIHKIVINKKNPKQICVFGQKSFNILNLNENNEFISLLDNIVELDDWIFDIAWDSSDQSNNSYLIIVCAHNQYVYYNLNKNTIEKMSYCNQKCMLYSAKILDFKKVNQSKCLENILISSGTIYNEILLWSPLNGNILITLNGHQGVIFNLEFSYENNFLFSTSDDRSINVWSLKFDDQINGEIYSRFYGHDARVWKCVSFTKNDIQYLCSIGEDLNCCLWNVNDKTLIYRFDAMRKGSKNIWSLSVNVNRMQIMTGWGDGGLRRFELRHYISKQDQLETESIEKLQENFEWNLTNENEKDFIRNLIILNGRIISCTNLGSLYMIETSSNDTAQKTNQKLLFKSMLLSNYSVMAKNLLNKNSNHWCLAIGTLKGFVYLLNIKFGNSIDKTDEITIDCINCLGIEEELAESSSSSATTKSSLQTIGSSKIFNIIWFKYKNRDFLLACFSLMNGLTHLYEFCKNSNQLNLIARLYLPLCKQRWITAYSIISIKTLNFNDDSSDDSFSNSLIEVIYLIASDKCGNLHLFKIELNKKLNNKLELDDNSEEEEENHLKLIKPLQTIKNVTKENSPISAIYSKNTNITESENDEVLKYIIICCCKDSFYRVFEFDSEYFCEENNDDIVDDKEKSENNQPQSSNVQFSKTMLKLINKYQINSYIDLIEYFIFEDEENEENQILKTFKSRVKDEINQNDATFNLENSLKLALCFYGDKFILWNFQLNRSLFESKCGGANRSWDYEFTNPINSNENLENVLFRFIYVKNKSIAESRKLLNKTEIERPFNQVRNHLCQIFHGNTITTCKYLKSEKYLLTGAEDTQLILTKIEKSKNIELIHEFHLQGHDSVVKCIDFQKINDHEVLLVSAGGKANIKLWKVIYNENLNENQALTINRITNLYEFKRKITNKKKDFSCGKNEKPWLYIDLKSNPDIRFMDVCIFKNEENDSIICFACSDGLIRIFRYILEKNKLFLVNKYEYSKCLLCIRHIKLRKSSQDNSENNYKNYLLSFGTDGCLLFWKLNLTDEEKPQIIKNINQSGINDVAIWKISDMSKILVATVGDDTRISLVEIELDDDENIRTVSPIIKFDQAHASAIMGVRFLNKDHIATVSKDQRLIIWKIDFMDKIIKPIKVLFINVADVSSMDLIQTEEGCFRFSLVGVGLEIIDFKLN